MYKYGGCARALHISTLLVTIIVCLRLSFLVSALFALVLLVAASPDSADVVPLPGPGLSYGGIPYGSMSGNVAEFFKHRAPPSGRYSSLTSDHRGNSVDYAAIEQFL